MNTSQKTPERRVRSRALPITLWTTFALVVGAVMAAPAFVIGGFFDPSPASVFFTTPNMWTKNEGAWRGETEAVDATISLHLESDHTAAVVRFPQGRSVQRRFKGEHDDEATMIWCVDTHATERYTGAATWRRIDDKWIVVSFPGSNIRIAPGYGRFSTTPDWTEVRFTSCDDLGVRIWRLGMECGPSRLPETHAGKPPTCELRHQPRPASRAGP